MKAELTSNSKQFSPVTIQITFETQREIDFAYDFLGNHTPLIATKRANSEPLGNKHIYTNNDSSLFLNPMVKILKNLLK